MMLPTPTENNANSTQTLVNALKHSFEQFGSSVAIAAPVCDLTYAELDELTSRVASELRTRIGEQRLKSEPIAILMSRSIELYVAEIAVLRAGGFFLPIDPAQPAERIEFLLSDSQTPLVLVRGGDSFDAPQSSPELFPINACQWKKDSGRDGQPASMATECLGEVSEADFAYMIYTSGSTGQPKGVPIEHQSIWNLCQWWKQEFGISRDQRTLQMMSVGFDASLEEILPTFVSGGTLVPVQPEALNSMGNFLDFIKHHQINKMHLPTAFFHTLVASFEAHESLELPSSIQTVVFGGELVDPIQVSSWFSRFGEDVRLINAYGPTETTVAASYAVLRPDNRPSIGTPIQGVTFSVVGDDGQLVEVGEAGELLIGGQGLASKYWRRDELSAEKFVICPLSDKKCYRTGDLVRFRSDGNYEFVGRIDDQIKLRGYRIEPGEISNCLQMHSQVRQAHVAARQFSSASNAQHLVGYVVLKSGEDLAEEELKEFLRQRLPEYMVPVAIVAMESFPVTAGGKLDLDRFPNPSSNQISDSQHDGDSKLLTPTEQKIGEVWASVLKTGQLGREANFFQIGGDSLSAMRLVLLLEAEFPGPVIPVAALIPNPTIASMAAYIDQRDVGSSTAVSQNWPLLTRLGASREPIRVVCLHAAGGGGMFYRQLYEGLERAIPIAVLESAILYQDGPVVCEHQSIAEMAQDYVDCLVDAGCEKKLTLVGYSFGCLLAFEMTRLLKDRGFSVERIINIDSRNPQKAKQRNFVSKFWCRFQKPGTLRERLDEFKTIRQRKRRIGELEKRSNANLLPPVELRSLALELEFGRLAKNYAPEPCDVTMHLICGEYPEAMYDIPSDYGWTDKVSELTVVSIPGGHNSIFDQPYLQALIKAFHEALLA